MTAEWERTIFDYCLKYGQAEADRTVRVVREQATGILLIFW